MIKLIREKYKGDNNQFGVLYFNDFYHSFCLENYEKRIPEGEYKFELYKSPNFGYLVPLLIDVLGRSYIEIHIANYEHELEGCIAPGETKTLNAVYSSKNAFDSLMRKINQELTKDYKIKIIEVEKL